MGSSKQSMKLRGTERHNSTVVLGEALRFLKALRTISTTILYAVMISVCCFLLLTGLYEKEGVMMMRLLEQSSSGWCNDCGLVYQEDFVHIWHYTFAFSFRGFICPAC